MLMSSNVPRYLVVTINLCNEVKVSSMATSTRKSPNIIVTGTPGVGKTTHSESLAERTGLRHLSINQIVKDKECHEGWSDEYHSLMVDEDKVRKSEKARGRQIRRRETEGVVLCRPSCGIDKVRLVTRRHRGRRQGWWLGH